MTSLPANGSTDARRSTRSRRCNCVSFVLAALLAPAAWADPLPDPATASATATAANVADAPRGDAQSMPMPGSADMAEPMATGADGLALTAGAAVWSGRFGFPTRTTILSDSFDARYRAGPVRISGTVPYLSITSDAAIFTGIDGTPLVAAPKAAALGLGRRRSGLGDLTLGAGLSVLREDQQGIDLSLSTRVKLPTASDRQLTTGRSDEAFGFTASKTFGRVAPIVSFTYRVFGKTATWRLRDGVAGSVGASYVAGSGTVLLLTYDSAERTSAYIGPSNQIVLGASRLIGGRFRLTGYASAGLSSGAAAVAAGLSLGVRLGAARQPAASG